jgi:catabolite regulation protein CreA
LSLEDSSSVSLSCRQVGEIKGKLESRKNIFRKSKSIFFKETVVDRFYDAQRGVMIYLTYTKDSFAGKNASNSVSVVVIRDRKE